MSKRLIRSVRRLIDSMYKNGYPSANEWAAVESALIELEGNEPANTGSQPTGGTPCEICGSTTNTHDGYKHALEEPPAAKA